MSQAQAIGKPCEGVCCKPGAQMSRLSVDVGDHNESSLVQAPESGHQQISLLSVGVDASSVQATENEEQSVEVPVQMDNDGEPREKRIRLESAEVSVPSSDAPTVEPATSSAETQPSDVVQKTSSPPEISSAAATVARQDPLPSTVPLPYPTATSSGAGRQAAIEPSTSSVTNQNEQPILLPAMTNFGNPLGAGQQAAIQPSSSTVPVQLAPPLLPYVNPMTARQLSDKETGYIPLMYSTTIIAMRKRLSSEYLLPHFRNREQVWDFYDGISIMLYGPDPFCENDDADQPVKYTICQCCEDARCVYNLITGLPCMRMDPQTIDYNGRPSWKFWLGSDKRKLLSDKLKLEVAPVTAVVYGCNHSQLLQGIDQKENCLFNESIDFFSYIHGFCTYAVEIQDKFKDNKRKLRNIHIKEQEGFVERLQGLPFTYNVIPFAVSEDELNSIKHLANSLYVELFYLRSSDEHHYRLLQNNFFRDRKAMSEDDHPLPPWENFTVELSNFVAGMMIDIFYTNRDEREESMRKLWALKDIQKIRTKCKTGWEVISRLGVELEEQRKRRNKEREWMKQRVEKELSRLRETLTQRCMAAVDQITPLKSVHPNFISEMISTIVKGEEDSFLCTLKNENHIRTFVDEALAAWTPDITLERMRQLI